MKRRDFLQQTGFLTISVATTGLAACGGGGGSGSGSSAKDEHKFPQGVASADPREDSIILWTRALLKSSDSIAASAEDDIQVSLQVTAADNSAGLGTTNALSGTAVADVVVSARRTYDHTIRHKLTGLQAGTTYFYQFSVGASRSRVGRFKTAPAASASPAQLKFGVLVCQDWSVNHWGAFSDLVTSEPNLDFFIHLGDYIYETVGKSFQTGSVEASHSALVFPEGTKNADGSSYATTINDYRYLYKRYRSDPRLQAVHERYAMIAVWDDHEFSDDCWGDAETYTHGTFNPSTGIGDNTRQTGRRRAANQAWFEHMPADVSFDDSVQDFKTIKIYRAFKFGTLANLVMTDQRLYRSDHVIPEAALPTPSSIGSRYMAPESILYGQLQGAKSMLGTAMGDPLALLSILGKEQREWWKARMSETGVTWKLWGSELMLLKQGLDGTKALATLVALKAISTLATNIGTAAGSLGGNLPAAAILVAAMTAGASQATAGAAAMAMAAAGGSAAAGVAAGLTTTQAGLAQAAYNAATAAAAGGATAQATAAAQVIAMGYIKADILEKKAASAFAPASLAAFFDKFVLNADAWDGFDAERKDLMSYLKTNGIKNVVALVGDIHAFYAGEVRDDYNATGGGTPVMSELVFAGASSDSFFTYLKDSVGALSADLATLVYYPLTVPVPNLGNITINVNLLDYTLAKAPPAAADLLEQMRHPVRSALAAKGVPEAALDATTSAVLQGIGASGSFPTLVGLAQTLSSISANPWLKHVDTDAQGYGVVTVTASRVSAEFRKVNKLVGGNAPAAPIVAKRKYASVAKDSPAVTVSDSAPA